VRADESAVICIILSIAVGERIVMLRCTQHLDPYVRSFALLRMTHVGEDCHAECNEASRPLREILRFAQDDTRGVAIHLMRFHLRRIVPTTRRRLNPLREQRSQPHHHIAFLLHIGLRFPEVVESGRRGAQPTIK
jgi:hypothetical protein